MISHCRCKTFVDIVLLYVQKLLTSTERNNLQCLECKKMEWFNFSVVSLFLLFPSLPFFRLETHCGGGGGGGGGGGEGGICRVQHPNRLYNACIKIVKMEKSLSQKRFKVNSNSLIP